MYLCPVLLTFAPTAQHKTYQYEGNEDRWPEKGTPNKENPIKGFIKTHSLAYFEPKEIVGDDGKKRTMSDFDCDMEALAPDDRVNAELRLLEFHTPKMKAIDVDMNAHVSVRTIEDKLRVLCGEEEDDDDDEDD